MKTLTRFAIAIAAVVASLIAVSCSRIENNEELSAARKFHASFETPASVTKTYLDSDHKLLWTADDRLSVFEGNTYNQQYRYTGQTGETSADFEKVQTSGFHSGNELDANYSIYPYLSDNKISNDGTMTISLPSVQPYAANSFGLGANTMVAVTNGKTDNFLSFKNLCGYLVIQLYGEGRVKKITFTGNNGEKIAGAASVVAVYGQNPSLAMAQTASTGITLDCGNGVSLGSTARTATEFWLCVPPTTFTEGFTMRVESTGGEVMEKSISTSRTIERNMIYTMSALQVEFEEPDVPEMVDLGLPSGLKWASCNLGASKPEEYGGYYQWAGLDDVTSTSIYLDYENCPYHTGPSDDTGWTKYVPSNFSSYWSGPGSPDNKTVLDPEDDVAHVTLGGKWRMPTDAEIQELFDNCTSEWTTLNGVVGRKFTSKQAGYTDKWIFLPAAGSRVCGDLRSVGSGGGYWSSSLDTGDLGGACGMHFGSGSVGTPYYCRYYGQSVRPVSE